MTTDPASAPTDPRLAAPTNPGVQTARQLAHEHFASRPSQRFPCQGGHQDADGTQYAHTPSCDALADAIEADRAARDRQHEAALAEAREQVETEKRRKICTPWFIGGVRKTCTHEAACEDNREGNAATRSRLGEAVGLLREAENGMGRSCLARLTRDPARCNHGAKTPCFWHRLCAFLDAPAAAKGAL